MAEAQSPRGRGGMTATATVTLPRAPGLQAGAEAPGHGEGGPASTLVIVAYGFWIFLISDIVMFSAFFAAHAVLQTATDGGPGPRDLFDLRRVAIETACLLLSSFTCGLSALGSEARRMTWTQAALLVTGLFGLAFLFFEVGEFASRG